MFFRCTPPLISLPKRCFSPYLSPPHCHVHPPPSALFVALPTHLPRPSPPPHSCRPAARAANPFLARTTAACLQRGAAARQLGAAQGGSVAGVMGAIGTNWKKGECQQGTGDSGLAGRNDGGGRWRLEGSRRAAGSAHYSEQTKECRKSEGEGRGGEEQACIGGKDLCVCGGVGGVGGGGGGGGRAAPGMSRQPSANRP